MYKFRASVFHTVVRWHKLAEVVNESTACLHNNIVLTIFVPKIIKVGGNLTKLCPKQFWLFLRHDVEREATVADCSTQPVKQMKTTAVRILVVCVLTIKIMF